MTEALTATLTTTQGTVTVRLFPDHAPLTVRNFVELAEGGREWTNPRDPGQATKDKLYDGTIFHRVITGFMIQGGDPLGTRHRRPGLQVRRRDPPRPAVRQAVPARDGERRPRHQRLAVLHHRRAHPVAQRQAHDLRRGHRRRRRGGQDQPRADRARRPPGARRGARSRSPSSAASDSGTPHDHTGPGQPSWPGNPAHLLPAPRPGDLGLLRPVRSPRLPRLPPPGGSRAAVRGMRTRRRAGHPPAADGLRRPAGRPPPP